MGLYPATGSITFNSRELVGDKTHHIVRQGIAYVPEDREIFSSLSVKENLALAERTKQQIGRAHV